MNVDSCILTGHKMCEQLSMCQKSLDSICDVSSVMQQWPQTCNTGPIRGTVVLASQEITTFTVVRFSCCQVPAGYKKRTTKSEILALNKFLLAPDTWAVFSNDLNNFKLTAYAYKMIQLGQRIFNQNYGHSREMDEHSVLKLIYHISIWMFISF